MLLQGNLKEFSLPNIFQLVKMSAQGRSSPASAWGSVSSSSARAGRHRSR